MGISFDIFKGGHESLRSAKELLARIDAEGIGRLTGSMAMNHPEVFGQKMPPMQGMLSDEHIPGMQGIENRPQHEAQEILASGAAAVSEAVEASPLITSELAAQVSEQDQYLNALRGFSERGSKLIIDAALNDGVASLQPGLAQNDLDLAG